MSLTLICFMSSESVGSSPSDTHETGVLMFLCLVPLMESNKTLVTKQGRSMAQVVSRRPLTAEVRVRARASHYGTCSG
jgi:hypothetical protein